MPSPRFTRHVTKRRRDVKPGSGHVRAPRAHGIDALLARRCDRDGVRTDRSLPRHSRRAWSRKLNTLHRDVRARRDVGDSPAWPNRTPSIAFMTSTRIRRYAPPRPGCLRRRARDRERPRPAVRPRLRALSERDNGRTKSDIALDECEARPFGTLRDIGRTVRRCCGPDGVRFPQLHDTRNGHLQGRRVSVAIRAVHERRRHNAADLGFRR